MLKILETFAYHLMYNYSHLAFLLELCSKIRVNSTEVTKESFTLK